MPAARDNDWTHCHVVGDRTVAAQYLPFARKLLGFVKHDASFNKLGVHKIVRRLDDGTVVTAEIHGNIPRITIQTAPRSQPQPPLPWFDYACSTFSSDFSKAEPLLLKFGKDDMLRAYFFSNKSFGYSKPAGTYGGAYPMRLKESGNDAHFLCGEIWHENEDGECVSWHGIQQHRYWYSPNRVPVSQGRGFVFHHGDILLDMYHYGLKFENRTDMDGFFVRAAALRKGWLYCVLSQMDRNIVYTVPSTPSTYGDIYMPPSYETIDARVYLVRFPLKITRAVGTGRPKYAVAGTLQILWNGLLHNGDGPWVFSKDLSVCSTVARPDENRYVRCSRAIVWPNPYADPPLVPYTLTENSAIYRVRLNFAATPRPATAFESELSNDVVIEDSGYQVSLVNSDHPLGGLDLMMRGRKYPLLRYFPDLPEGEAPIPFNGGSWFSATIMHCDPVNDVLILQSQHVAETAGENYTSTYDYKTTIYRAGASEDIAVDSFSNQNNDGPGVVSGMYNLYQFARSVGEQAECGVTRLYLRMGQSEPTSGFGLPAPNNGTYPEHGHAMNMFVLPASRVMYPEINSDFGGFLAAQWLYSDDPDYNTWNQFESFSLFAQGQTGAAALRPPTNSEAVAAFRTVAGGGAALSDEKRVIYAGEATATWLTVGYAVQSTTFVDNGDLQAATGGFFNAGLAVGQPVRTKNANFVKLGKPPLRAAQLN